MERREREREEPGMRYSLKDTSTMIYFLQLGLTSETYYHLPIMPSNYESPVD
jgi:hypothetical protein